MPTLFSLPTQRAFDANGDPLPGARLTFYQTGTSTLKGVYQNAALSVAHSNPVIADSSGVFAPIYLASGEYRVQLADAGGVQKWQYDGVSSALSGADMLALLAPVDGAGSGLDADTVDGVEGSALAKLASADFTALQVGGIPVGYRGAPRLSGAGGDAVAAWGGKCYASTGNITIQPNIHAAGDWFKVYNDSEVQISVQRGVGLTMYLAGSDVASILVDPHVSLEIWFNSATEAVVLGGGSDGGIGGTGSWGTPNMTTLTALDMTYGSAGGSAGYRLLSTGARDVWGGDSDSYDPYWISPQAGMNQHEVQAVLVSGNTPSGASVIGSGNWQLLNANASWTNVVFTSGVRTSVLDISIRQVGTTTPVYTGRITISVVAYGGGVIPP